MTVVGLKQVSFEKTVNMECVDILREWLIAAEAGNVVGIAIAIVEPDGKCVTTSSASNHFQAVLGALSILQHRMIALSEA